MEVNRVNTQTVIANLRAEGQSSRAEYVELLALRIEELEAAQQNIQATSQDLLIWAIRMTQPATDAHR